MRPLYTRFLLLFLACGLASAGFAQAPHFQFEHLAVADGLPENSVGTMLQDTLGFLWIGTQRGLVRYDGYAMRTYKAYPEDPDSLSHGEVFALYEDQKGRIWIGTWNGLCRYIRETDRFKRYFLDTRPHRIYEDRTGTLWVGTRSNLGMQGRGLYRYEAEADTFTVFRHDAKEPTSLSHDRVEAIYEDRKGRLWVGTALGLDRFDAETETPGSGPGQAFTHFIPDPEAVGRYDPARGDTYTNWVNVIIEDAEGVLWIGTLGGGLYRFDPETQQFTRFRHDPGDAMSLSSNRISGIYKDKRGVLWVGTWGGGLNRMDRERGTFKRFFDEEGMNVRHIYEDRAGLLWIGTSKAGGRGELFHYDQAQEAFHRYAYDKDNPGSYSGGNVFTFFEDRSGILWIGTWMLGLNKLDRSRSKFTTHHYDPNHPGSLNDRFTTAFHVSSSEPDVVWIGTREGGLNRLDRRTGTYTYYQHDPDDPGSLSHNWVYSIVEDVYGTLWVGTWGGGLNRFDRASGTFKRYLPDPNDPASLSNGFVSMIIIDQDELWVGTFGGGLNRFDRETETFTQYWNDPRDSTSISYNSIVAGLEDRQGTLWFGANGPRGLNKFDRETGAFTRFGPYKDVWRIHEDGSGRFWVITFNDGLCLFDREAGTYSGCLTEENGLPAAWVVAFLEDDTGNLWLGTERGLARFNPKTGMIRTYDMTDGLTANWVYSSFQSESGEMFWGSDNGFISFFPDQVRDSPYAPPVVLTGFKLSGESVAIAGTSSEAGHESPLRQDITVAESITLRHDENDFSFTFAAISFRYPEKNRYRYRMEGYDPAWREAGTRREASYMNLPPGPYLFRVQGTNNDGVWSSHEATILLTVLPPWWRTWWAYGVYLLAFIGLMAGAFRLQRTRLQGQAEIEQARLRADAAELQAQAAEMQAQAAESQARALEAENERNRIEAEKAHELEKAYHELEATHANLQTTQAQLVQSEKMASLGQLTSGIAHELKNPLNFVTNFAEVNEELSGELKEFIRDNQEQRIADLREDLEDIASGLRLNSRHIVQHGKRADAIVKSMMEHAHDASGERYDVGVNKLVEEYTGLAYHGVQAQEPGLDVKIEHHLDASVGNVEMAPQELGRALLAVLNNALDAVHKKAEASDGDYKPTVKVTTCQLDGQVEVRVCDNGPGIPKEMQQKIFEPFFTTKPTGSGTGLGLSLAYDIVTQGHGGTLTVESEKEKGATFIITLPS